jgi:transposase-like protein
MGPRQYYFQRRMPVVPAAKPPEFRRKALDLVATGEPVAKVAKGLGISEGTLRWCMDQDNVGSGRVEGLTSAEKRELIEPRRKTRALEMENEIHRRCSQNLICLPQLGDFFLQPANLRLVRSGHARPDPSCRRFPNCGSTLQRPLETTVVGCSVMSTSHSSFAPVAVKLRSTRSSHTGGPGFLPRRFLVFTIADMMPDWLHNLHAVRSAIGKPACLAS